MLWVVTIRPFKNRTLRCNNSFYNDDMRPCRPELLGTTRSWSIKAVFHLRVQPYEPNPSRSGPSDIVCMCSRSNIYWKRCINLTDFLHMMSLELFDSPVFRFYGSYVCNEKVNWLNTCISFKSREKEVLSFYIERSCVNVNLAKCKSRSISNLILTSYIQWIYCLLFPTLQTS